MTHPFEQKIQDAIDSRHLLDNTTDTIICTLSGGADSVALLAALTQLGYRCLAAHCNFHLRGTESMRDQHHAHDIANQLGATFVAKDMDVDAYRSSNKVSIEMACREMRYDWFHNLMDSTGAQAIAVAHNRTDNIETIFLNMLRGTGIDGLRGMKWRTLDRIIRPMLAIDRKEIEEYLTDRNLKFVTDSTNLTDEFTRNRIRHQILPAIERTKPHGLKNIEQTITHLDQQAALYHSLIGNAISRCKDSQGGIDLTRIALYPHGALLLYESLKHIGLSKQQAHDALTSRHLSGTRFFTPTSTLINDHGVLRIDELDIGTGCQFPFMITKHPVGEFNPQRDPNTAYFDASVLDDPRGLSFRYWQHGDTVAPFGMRGTKKLSDIFSDAKLSLAQKKQVPLLMLGDTILWVGGLRASKHFPVTPHSKYFIKVELK